MKNDNSIKDIVKEKYAAIAQQSRQQNVSSCCGATHSAGEVYNIMSDDYNKIDGYQPDADLGLGCGLPTEFAKLKEGQTVVDLGSGAGNDAFVARRAVGDKGQVIGIDFTEAMILQARYNTAKLGLTNVEFRLGDIENIPVKDNIVDVVISNCVLNLVPNKQQVFAEIFRILKPGGHFSISDIALRGELPAQWKEVAELYAGCVSGAVQQQEYLNIIKQSGFSNIIIQKEKVITIPDEILLKYFSAKEINDFRNNKKDIVSITVYAEKSITEKTSCCEPGSGCC